MKFAATALLLAASTSLGSATNPIFVGYPTASEVTEHGNLDLDVRDILTAMALSTPDVTEATRIYSDGKNSNKANSLRTLKGFSADAASKMTGETHHSLAKAQFKSATWADTYVAPLFAATTSAKTLATALNFLITAPYVMHELADARADCVGKDLTDNDAGVKAWDEGVAFYAGSLAVIDVASEFSVYGMIAGLGTKGAALNTDILAHFEAGGAKITAQECTLPADLAIIDAAIDGIRVGFLSAAINLLDEANDATPRDAATAAALSQFILPEINVCNSDKTEEFKASFLVSDLELDFPCMGVSCDDITKGCSLPTASTTVAGYAPDSNVVPHSLLDKDILRVGQLTSVQDYASAKITYTQGLNSVKGDGLRKLQALSLGASKMEFPEAQLFKAYFGDSASYADDIISAALDGTGDFVGVEDITRKEMIVKSIQYSTLFMYVLRELHDAVDDCNSGAQNANVDAVHAWDEGWVFYAGSLEGIDGTGKGEILHALAEKRAGNFSPTNDANAAVLQYFLEGKVFLNNNQCAEAALLIPKIRTKMIVPNVQGALRYAYKVPQGGAAKEIAEGWAFARAVLPFVNECDANAATVISRNQDFKAATPMADGMKEVFLAYQSVFDCLNIDCADIGELEGATACNTFAIEGSASGLKMGSAGIFVVMVVGAILGAF